MENSIERQAYMLIKHKLLNGELHPSKTYSENSLSTSLGIGRTPVRYALKQLESEGFIAYRKNRGVSVRIVPLREMLDILGVSMLFQKFAVEQVAAGYSSFSFEKLDTLVDEAQTLRTNTLYLNYLMKLVSIYNCIIEAARNRIMLDFHQSSWERLITTSLFNAYQQSTVTVPAKKQTTIGQLKVIIGCLKGEQYEQALRHYDELMIYYTNQLSYYSFL
ncbi:MAG: GntR family transcriptional regulator [Sporolactobacillus sp.]